MVLIVSKYLDSGSRYSFNGSKREPIIFNFYLVGDGPEKKRLLNIKLQWKE